MPILCVGQEFEKGTLPSLTKSNDSPSVCQSVNLSVCHVMAATWSSEESFGAFFWVPSHSTD